MIKGEKTSFRVFAFCLVLACLGGAAFLAAQEAQIAKPKIFEEYYQLISEADLYCSFFLYEEGKPLPDMRIIGAEREWEKNMFSDADTVYLSKGEAEGVEIGQVFLVVGMGEKVGKYGRVMERRGRAKVVRLEDHIATARLEKTCGGVRVGDFLVPYEEEAGEIGKDTGYGDMDPNATRQGKVIYVDSDFRIAGSNQWVLIDLGRQHCVQVGDKLTVFFRARQGLPREAVASAIVIDVRGASSTVKVLSARDAVRVGSEVQMNELR